MHPDLRNLEPVHLAGQQFGAWKGTMMWMGEVARARSLGKHV